MSTYVYIPKPYTISGQAALVDTISSPLTYKSAQVNSTLTPSVGGYMCAYGEGLNLLAGASKSSVPSKLNAFVSESSGSSAALSGRVIHFAPCTRYAFPGLEKADWSPDVFRDDIVYHNNMSGTGQFIGRSIIRRGRDMSVAPISFNAPASRMVEIRAMLDAMEKAPFYVKVCAPYATYVVYGWTTGTPNVSYSADFGQVTVSFSMRTTA